VILIIVIEHISYLFLINRYPLAAAEILSIDNKETIDAIFK